MGVEVDKEIAQAVERTAAVLDGMGHHVSEESPEFDGLRAMRTMTDVWFFGFDLRLATYAQRSGRAIGPDTLEPVTFRIYEHAKRMSPAHFLNALAAINTARRQLALNRLCDLSMWACMASRAASASRSVTASRIVSCSAIAARQERTDSHLNTLIDTFERHLREDHGGQPS